MRSKRHKDILSILLADPSATPDTEDAAVELCPELLAEVTEDPDVVVDPVAPADSFDTGRAGESGSPVEKVEAAEVVPIEPKAWVDAAPADEADDAIAMIVEAFNVEDGLPAEAGAFDAVVLAKPEIFST
ncbi:hypothetical protein MMC13_005363 [Lambiella insularis]|nr:hypothetical protein [Lambiella insularis]